MNKDKALKQALELIERLNKHGWILADFETEVYAALASLKAALEQPPLPVQEPTPWRDMIVVTLVREGINKHKARELADHFAAQPVQEPVAYDYHTKYDRGCYKCRSQFCPGNCIYTTPPLPVQEQQQAKPMAWDKPSASFDEWWDGDRRRDTANPFTTDSFSYWAFEGWQAALAQPVQEPVGEVVEVNNDGFRCEFNRRLAVGTKLYIAPPLPVQEPWGACVSGRVFVGALPEHVRKLTEDDGLPIQLLYTTPPAPQRPWVGLTEDEKFEMAAAQYGWEDLLIAAEAKLKERNT